MPRRFRRALTPKRPPRRGWHSRPRWSGGWRPLRPRPGAERRSSVASAWPRPRHGRTRRQGGRWRSWRPGSWRRARCPSLMFFRSTLALEAGAGEGGLISTACAAAADEARPPDDSSPPRPRPRAAVAMLATERGGGGGRAQGWRDSGLPSGRPASREGASRQGPRGRATATRAVAAATAAQRLAQACPLSASGPLAALAALGELPECGAVAAV
mmetsp:Transcript_5639/g.23906  ORF Transcript_5639/g.23906 Transcript_5639/m.23906 type:complete len:214 (+) Transcript_5639:185-826(+)